jgi:hypothetical protein
MISNITCPGQTPKSPAKAFIIISLLITVFVTPSMAEDSYYWYDSGVKKGLHMDSELVADFDSASDEESAVRKANPNASRVKGQHGGTKLWKVASPKSAVKKSAAMKPGAGVSPVFREGGHPGGRIMSLPGNVVVFFKSDWSEQTVKDWVAAQNLEIVDKLNIGKNAYVIKTGPGLESLNLANKLQESGEVESATPNWWKPSQHR